MARVSSHKFPMVSVVKLDDDVADRLCRNDLYHRHSVEALELQLYSYLWYTVQLLECVNRPRDTTEGSHAPAWLTTDFGRKLILSGHFCATLAAVSTSSVCACTLGPA